MRKLTHFTVSASQDVVEKENAEVKLSARARFDNGPEADVTAWTVFTSADNSGVTLSQKPVMAATVLRRGQHIVIARFLDRVEPIRLTRPLGDKPIELSAEPRANWIDEEIHRTLTVLRMPFRRRRRRLSSPRPARFDRHAAEICRGGGVSER